jgi:hypothetical protein
LGLYFCKTFSAERFSENEELFFRVLAERVSRSASAAAIVVRRTVVRNPSLRGACVLGGAIKLRDGWPMDNVSANTFAQY